MNENNLTLSVRDLKEIKDKIQKSNNDIIDVNGKLYMIKDKENSVELLTNLIDVVRVRNGIIYG